MKKEWILTAEDKLQYRNKQLRKRLELETISSQSETTSSSQPESELSFLKYCLLNDNYGDINLQNPQFNPQINHLNPFPPHSLILPEQNLISELSTACSVIINKYKQIRDYNKDYLPIGSNPICPYALKRIQQMARNLHAFSSLQEADKLAIFQYNLVDVMSLRTILIYDSNRESWCLADDKNKVSVMASIHILKPFCIEDGFERQKNLPNQFRDEWKRDSIIFDILTVIVLFTPPHDDNAVFFEPQKVSNQQARYCRLLSRYLCTKYGDVAKAEESYYQILANVDEMKKLTIGFWNLFQKYKDAFRDCPLLFRLLQIR